MGNHAIVPLLHATQTAPLSCSAVTLAPILVPAMSQMNIIAKVQSAIGEPEDMSSYTGILEPRPPSLLGLLVARTLAHVKTGITHVRVMNPTNSDVPCDTRLGDFHSLGSQEDEEFSIEEVTTATIVEVKSQATSESLPGVDLSQSAVNDEQCQQLEALLLSYSDVFSAHDQDYGCTNVVKHSIKTGDASPCRQRAYRTSPHTRAEIDKQVQQLLSQDITEESCSLWAAPVVLVKKKDGTYWFCIDFRKLNAVTIKDSYPLPRPADALDSLSGACWFSTMDLSSGYWQVELDTCDKEKSWS